MFLVNPPFTTFQLQALTIDEEFEVINWPKLFNVKATSLKDAFKHTFADKKYSRIVLKF